MPLSPIPPDHPAAGEPRSFDTSGGARPGPQAEPPAFDGRLLDVRVDPARAWSAQDAAAYHRLEPPTEAEAVRDRLWCEALIATLDLDAMDRVLREFNRRRLDAALDASPEDRAEPVERE